MARSLTLGLMALLAAFAAACAEKQSGGETTASPNAAHEPDAADEDAGDAVSIEEMRERALAEIDVEACEAGGGDVRQEGMLGLPRCVKTYADAGKTCSSSDDCEGRCLGDDATTDYNAAPGEMTGLCETDDSPFGCYAEIEDGTSTGMLCVD